jgi:hypothetical protein
MPAHRFPLPWTVEELDARFVKIESRIKKNPEFRPEVFLYATKSGARGYRGMGKAPDSVVTLGQRLF